MTKNAKRHHPIADADARKDNTRPYYPEYRDLTGSVISAILLNQINFLRKGNGGTFYKFKQPCGHELYVQGDSWCEELNITTKEFDGAIKRIGFKKGKTQNNLTKETAFVWYYTDSSQLTHYEMNMDYFEEKLAELEN